MRHSPCCLSIPSDHDVLDDYSAECYGYAMARAYGKTWNDPDCPAHSHPGDAISGNYFKALNDNQNDFSYYNIQVGDIITFSDHAVYVQSYNQIWDEWTIAEKANPAATTENTRWLSDVVAQQGAPLRLWRKKMGTKLK